MNDFNIRTNVKKRAGVISYSRYYTSRWKTWNITKLNCSHETKYSIHQS